jgi:hypothetical protein
MDAKYLIGKDPCDSCPYRRDTPPGVWDRSEYEKLPTWDTDGNLTHEQTLEQISSGIFLCHQFDPNAKQPTLCRGWLEVHQNNLAVRMVMFRTDFRGHNEPTKIPLYQSGAEACKAGLKGVRKPSTPAKIVIEKITRKRSRKR